MSWIAVRAVTPDTIVSVAAPPMAAYVGADPATVLPDTLTATRADGSTSQVPVSWDVSGVDFGTAYTTVTVDGTVDGFIGQVPQSVAVIPPGVVYYVDSDVPASAADTAMPYSVISAALAADGRPLLNKVPDQSIADDGATWGYDPDGIASHESASPPVYTDEYTTGWYALNTATYTNPVTGSVTQNAPDSIVYTFTLPAGSYSLATGMYEWWYGPRYITVSVVGTDADGTAVLDQVIAPDVAISAASPVAVVGGEFTMPKDGTVAVRFDAALNANGALVSTQSPQMAWIGIARDARVPVIGSQPADVAVVEGAPAEFSVSASSPDTGAVLAYQWQVSVDGGATFADVPGADAPSYSLASALLGDDGTQYRCVVTADLDGTTASATSDAATLTVTAAPTQTPTESPTVTPTEPTVSPTEPTVTPTEPTVSPTEPTVSPTEPMVSPTEPTSTASPTASESSAAPSIPAGPATPTSSVASNVPAGGATPGSPMGLAVLAVLLVAGGAVLLRRVVVR
jgi:hypothetical protein